MGRSLPAACLAAVLVITLGASPSSSQGAPAPVPIEQRGPPLGSVAPPIRLRDQRDRERTLETLVGKDGLVLLFVRSADW